VTPPAGARYRKLLDLASKAAAYSELVTGCRT
jgi:hypothetical protein